MRVWDDQQPSTRHFRGSLGLALLLHLIFWFAPTSEQSRTAFGATFAEPVGLAQISLKLRARTKGPAALTVTDPKAIEPARTSVASVASKHRGRAAKAFRTGGAGGDRGSGRSLGSISSPRSTHRAPCSRKSGPHKIMLEGAFDGETLLANPIPARRRMREAPAPAPALTADPGAASAKWCGEAWSRAFAFGGPTGAFRAEVCAIRIGVKSVKEVTSCPPLATFFTNTLNVAPRGFSEGFPGVTARTEWFAIRYRGNSR